ncbi:hypothetical protein DSCO28_34540 [Desulfosarcina ovata subsp. sediminis]|uniref:Uncharacterized protein n=1 Tax=Desulfosarcina ovata subsp. sediminis TaxID=885957 RepID=A0A5K7ZKX0_9BACT|nr:hypothetical protein DSCO28_34540 [Desulfosarcina ovata subsp. sediminis]
MTQIFFYRYRAAGIANLDQGQLKPGGIRTRQQIVGNPHGSARGRFGRNAHVIITDGCGDFAKDVGQVEASAALGVLDGPGLL